MDGDEQRQNAWGPLPDVEKGFIPHQRTNELPILLVAIHTYITHARNE